ncbi:MAG: hypothetical protein MI867_22410, partial [Pseudomonadales bacterium]|nr:hypothetical protein [Pseudomonadales bacterium]
MFKNKLNVLLPSAFAALPMIASADDLDIYAGETVEVSAPVELVFAVDTSTSMACSPSQSFSDDRGDCYESFYGAQAGSSKADIVQDVLTDLFEDTDVLPDAVRVGLAYYNEPGGSIVRPINELSAATGIEQYPTQRSLLINEVDAFIPGGSTPILGTLLEIGQYLTGERVVSGISRKGSPLVSTDSTGWGGEYVAQTFGEVARISNENTIIPGTGSYRASTECLSAITNNAISGAYNAACSGENLANSGLNFVTYNEDINSASVCSASADSGDTTVTTQVVLITDGLPTLEQMSLPMHDTRMGTWVKRFVTGDSSETGFLAVGEGALPMDSELPQEAHFADFGCPVTANVNSEYDEEEITLRLDIINNHPVGAPPTRDYLVASAWLDRERGKASRANIIPGDLINTAASYSASDDFFVNRVNDANLTLLERTIPDFDTQRNYYESCLFNVALRFRELGVKVHVIGFGLDGDGVDNSLLEKITQITDGQWIATSDASTLSTFFESIASSSIKSSAVRATMSPSVSVNPGSILSNSDEVYFPMFKAGASNFLYGNLKKYRLETDTENTGDSIAATRIVDANGIEATETCDVVNDNGETVGQYSCFRSTSESFWSDEVDGAIVTKGGAASQLGVFGLDPDGDRRVYIQNGDDLDSLQLISAAGADSDTMDNEGSGNPDDSAYLVDIANPATKNLYSRLVPIPESPGVTFSSYAALSAHDDEENLKLYGPAYDMVRWLIGVDERRFDNDGIYSPILSGQEGAQSERALLVDSNGDSLAPSLRAILDD